MINLIPPVRYTKLVRPEPCFPLHVGLYACFCSDVFALRFMRMKRSAPWLTRLRSLRWCTVRPFRSPGRTPCTCSSGTRNDRLQLCFKYQILGGAGLYLAIHSSCSGDSGTLTAVRGMSTKPGVFLPVHFRRW